VQRLGSLSGQQGGAVKWSLLGSKRHARHCRDCHEFYLLTKTLEFDSTIKGSGAPNDLDVLLFAENAGARQKWQVVGFDPVYYKAHGFRTTRPTSREAKMWLRKGMQTISTYDTESEATIFDKKVEIYPRFLLK
jgi:hypothetical protein